MTTTYLRNRRSSSSEDEDDLVCEYDSTWEETGCDYKEENSQRHRWRRNSRAARDMQTYRHGYPVSEREKYQSSIWYAHSDLHRGEQMVNLRFYRNDIPSSPDKVYITEFHKCWKGDYKRLERVHSYIQWLFPLQEPGMNYSAQVLTKKEVKAFCEDQEAKERLVTSYELMLDFYGIKLVNKSTGEVARSENWMEQFDNLNRNTHNNLRITRILKSLGDLGFQHYQAPLVKFFLEETLIHGNLAYVKQSVMDYFLFAVLDKKKRRELIEYAFRHYKPRFEFVWCPKKIQRRLLEAEKNQDDLDREKGGLLGESGCDQENETNVTEESPATSNAFQYQASSVDPLESFSVEQPPPVNRVMDQPSSPDSGSLNEDSTSEGHIQGPGVEHSPPLQELVTDETAQEVGTEAKTESSRVPVETQSNSQDIKKNSTTDDTSAAEQEPALEMQNKKEMGGMVRNPSDSFAEEMHHPDRNKDGLSVSCNPVQCDGDVTGPIDPQVSKSSGSSTAAGVEESLNCIGKDTESKRSLCTGPESHEPAGAAENNNRPKGVNESHQLQAKGVEIYKLEDGGVESSGPKGGVEDSVSLERAVDLPRPEDEATVSNTPECGVKESLRLDIGADEDQRPEGAVEDTASGNDAGNVLFNPDEVKARDNAMNGVNECHQPQAKGVESYKLEDGGVESSGPKGGVEDSVSLERAVDLPRPEDEATVSNTPEGGVKESLRLDIGADEDQRPEGAVEDTASGNDAGNVLFNPDEVKARGNAMNGVNECHQPQAKGVESYKLEDGGVESSGPKGGVEDSVSLERAVDLPRPEDEATVSNTPEGGVSESLRSNIEADEDQRPEGAVEDTASGNDAGNVLFSPDEVIASDDAMIYENSGQTPREDRGGNEDCGEQMDIEVYSVNTESEMEH